MKSNEKYINDIYIYNIDDNLSDMGDDLWIFGASDLS